MAFGDKNKEAQEKAALKDANKMGQLDDGQEVNNEKQSFMQRWEKAGEKQSLNVEDAPPSTPALTGKEKVQSFRNLNKANEDKKSSSFNDRNKDSYSRNVADVSNAARKEEGLKESYNTLDPKLVIIIEKVCTFLNKSKNEVDEIMEKAIKNPESIRTEYDKMYNSIVQPKTQERYKNISEAQAKNPDRIVFMSVKDGEDKLIGLSRDKFPSFEIYQGTIMQTVDFDRTPFDAPSKVFDNKLNKEKEKENTVANSTSVKPKI